MSPADFHLLVAAIAGIVASVLLIVAVRLHPFISLLCGAFLVGMLAGLPAAETAAAIQKGAGDILGGTGLVVALGLSLGAMLHLSNGAAALARGALQLCGPAAAPWASLLAAMVIGLPLFFETGLVLLLPIVVAAATALHADAAGRLRLMLPALAGLSVMHALVPPHPGPLLAVDALGANMALTMGYGVLIAIPVGIIAGPLIAPWLARGITLTDPVLSPTTVDRPAPKKRIALLVVLMPVVLIAAGQTPALLPTSLQGGFAWTTVVASPVLALLLANLAALPLLFGRHVRDSALLASIWKEALTPAGAILLAIGAGGALKQVLVSAGLSDLLARLATSQSLSPLLMAWLIAVGIRLATGSATVATITTAGVIPGVVAATGASPEWVVLAIGCGSVFFSHVNDPGFWLVRSYLGTTTAATFRTWSVLETVIAVAGLLFVLMGNALLS